MKLFHGDCLEKLKKIKSESIDLILTSPPYDNLRAYEGETSWDYDTFQRVAVQLTQNREKVQELMQEVREVKDYNRKKGFAKINEELESETTELPLERFQPKPSGNSELKNALINIGKQLVDVAEQVQ